MSKRTELEQFLTEAKLLAEDLEQRSAAQRRWIDHIEKFLKDGDE